MTKMCERNGCNTIFATSQRKARFCSDGCRVAAWKENRGYVDQRRSGSYRNGLRSGDRAYSGAQVSFNKAVDEVGRTIAHHLNVEPAAARRVAEAGLMAALPERQRQRLEARGG